LNRQSHRAPIGAPACRSLFAALIASLCAVAGCGSSGTAPVGSGGELRWFVYERDAEHPATLTERGQTITLRDGVRLSVNLMYPAGTEGVRAPGRFPVILTQTGYNKSVPVFRTSNAYFVQRGYIHVSVDVRGTGQSEGSWEAFSETEQADYSEVLDWIVAQPWCDGRIGTWGASFAAITQLFTAARQHPAHKAVFAIVPMGDAYRDIVFTGGQINAGFIPLWMGIVTAMGLIPADPNALSAGVLAQHIVSALTDFQFPVVASAALGVNGQNYDGPFWRTRSPLEIADRIDTPTFVVGGLNDIFQRGQPLLYEALRRRTSAKLLIGPWMHVDGSTGAGLPEAEVPDLDRIALMWFDRHVRGIANGADSVPQVTQYVYGAERYVTSPDWPHPQATAQRRYLRGDGGLTSEMPGTNEAAHTVLQQPLNGVCSASSAQWTAGVLGSLPLDCFGDNRFNERLFEQTYSTEMFDEPLYVNGPIQADIWISTTSPDAGLVVRITDVHPDGTSRELTNGILTASLRAVDESRSRFLDGQMIQPWHPFTAASRQPLERGVPVPLAVEIFPTSFVIQPGHRLRVSIGASDFPHGVPPLTDFVTAPTGLLTILSDAAHASSVVFPVVPVSALAVDAPLP
jgi:uncharacterized protein